MAASQYSLINKSDKYQFLDMINDIYNICEFAHKVYMKSIEELEKYLEDECYSFTGINIGKHHAHEGIVIEKMVMHMSLDILNEEINGY